MKQLKCALAISLAFSLIFSSLVWSSASTDGITEFDGIKKFDSGDYNSDNVINILDLVCLKKSIANNSVGDSEDLADLRQKLFFWDVDTSVVPTTEDTDVSSKVSDKPSSFTQLRYRSISGDDHVSVSTENGEKVLKFKRIYSGAGTWRGGAIQLRNDDGTYYRLSPSTSYRVKFDYSVESYNEASDAQYKGLSIMVANSREDEDTFISVKSVASGALESVTTAHKPDGYWVNGEYAPVGVKIPYNAEGYGCTQDTHNWQTVTAEFTTYTTLNNGTNTFDILTLAVISNKTDAGDLQVSFKNISIEPVVLPTSFRKLYTSNIGSTSSTSNDLNADKVLTFKRNYSRANTWSGGALQLKDDSETLYRLNPSTTYRVKFDYCVENYKEASDAAYKDLSIMVAASKSGETTWTNVRSVSARDLDTVTAAHRADEVATKGVYAAVGARVPYNADGYGCSSGTHNWQAVTAEFTTKDTLTTTSGTYDILSLAIVSNKTDAGDIQVSFKRISIEKVEKLTKMDLSMCRSISGITPTYANESNGSNVLTYKRDYGSANTWSGDTLYLRYGKYNYYKLNPSTSYRVKFDYCVESYNEAADAEFKDLSIMVSASKTDEGTWYNARSVSSRDLDTVTAAHRGEQNTDSNVKASTTGEYAAVGARVPYNADGYGCNGTTHNWKNVTVDFTTQDILTTTSGTFDNLSLTILSNKTNAGDIKVSFKDITVEEITEKGKDISFDIRADKIDGKLLYTFNTYNGEGVSNGKVYWNGKYQAVTETGLYIGIASGNYCGLEDMLIRFGTKISTSVNPNFLVNNISKSITVPIEGFVFAKAYIVLGGETIYTDCLLYNASSEKFQKYSLMELSSIQQCVIPKYNASYTTVLCLNELGKAIAKKTGDAAPQVVKDNAPIADTELIVGKTNHFNNNETFGDSNSYSIRLADNNKKIIVDGGSVQAINKAINVLTEKISANEGISYYMTGIIDEDNIAGDYNAILTDNFDGNSLSNIWTVWGKNPDANFETYKNNNKTEIVKCGRSFNNINVKDGKLYQKVTCGTTTAEGGVTTKTVYGSKMDTAGNFWFKYGYTEVSAKVASGLGFGSGFWLHGDDTIGNSYPEYDIVEIYGDAKYNRVSPMAHKRVSESELQSSILKNWNLSLSPYKDLMNTADPDKVNWNCFNLDIANNESFADSFHTFGFEWDENCYSFILDGEVIYTTNYANNGTPEQIASYQSPVSAIISINCGNFSWNQYNGRGNSDFSDNNWEDDNVYTVDYFTVYQKEGQYYSSNKNDSIFG